MDKNNSAAVIVLHEIYGVNGFMERVCARFYEEGYDAYCPALGPTFSYEEEEEAYRHFTAGKGFDAYGEITQLAETLKERYERLLIMGFSAGGTVAWRCCESGAVDGLICCYGSRIRDYLTMNPRCPVLCLFGEEPSFDVDGVIEKLREKPQLEIHRFAARHGFMDPDSRAFDRVKAEEAGEIIKVFLNKLH